MLIFPSCKINLGLNIVQKRPDGFHNIETVFYPLNWCDALEVIDNGGNEPFIFSSSGLAIEGKIEDNLIYKAWRRTAEIKNITNIKVHLHKNLPMGAGLGGGSADAAFFVNLLNTKYSLGLSVSEKAGILSGLGSDCTFFIRNIPVLATGKGDLFSTVKVDLSPYYILVIYPNIHSNTKEAYTGVTPQKPADLKNMIENVPVTEWKTFLKNDFEDTIFIKYPKIKEIKELLYNHGAIYSAMSGSGSSIFGIFNQKPVVSFDPAYRFYLQTPAPKIL